MIPESGRSPGEGIGYLLQYSWASLVAQTVKEFTCNAGDLGSIPGLELEININIWNLGSILGLELERKERKKD